MKPLPLYIKQFITAVFLLVMLNACMKNSKYYNDFSTVGASVDLPLAAANSNNPVTFTYSDTVTTPTLPVYVNLASPAVLGTPVTLTLAIDSAALDSLNFADSSSAAASGGSFTPYVLLPSNAYTVTGFNRTIPAGQRLDSMVITFKFSQFDLTQNYMLPVVISQASEPIEQWNRLFLNIVVNP